MILFKNQKVEERFSRVHEKLKEISEELGDFCTLRQQIFLITEALTTLEEDIKIKRASTTHREGRAIDIRTREWDSDFIEEFIEYACGKFGHLGAINSLGKRVLIVDKSRLDNPHLHLQIEKKFKVSGS